MIWNEFGVGMTSLNEDHPGEIIASSKSSMKASAGVFMRTRVPVPLQTPVGGIPLEVPVLVLVPGPVLLVVGPVFVPVLLLVVGPLWVAVVLLVVPPVPGLALPEEHACERPTAPAVMMIDTCNARMRFIISPRFSQVRRWPLRSS
jgi:hypothetical protein